MVWSMSATQLAALVPLAVVAVEMIRRLIQNRIDRKGYPLPPGPTPLPLVGSVLSIDPEEPFKTYTEWRAKYGDIVYIRRFDTDVVILNSVSAATELLDKRSQFYSSRPFLATVKPYGHDCDFAFLQYGEHWRLCRRIFHETFSINASVSFHPMQLRKAREMVVNVINNPSDYQSHYSTFAAGATMRSVYDYDPSPQNDQMVSVITKFIEVSFPAILSDKAVLLKTFPFLLHIPEWLPGSWIRREARMSRELGAKTVEAPYQYVRKRMESKEHVNPSMVSDHITRMEKFDESYRSAYENALKQTSLTAFLASVESSTASLMTFTLAMVRNPRIWKRAQAEIDAVVGTERLPELGDRPSLPYVEAIVRETWRWQPPGPLGIPHATTKSDIYNGFYIPKGISNVFTGGVQDDICSTGASVLGNIWAMSRDESRYPNADSFIPERFFNTEGMLTDDRPDFIFGFGRRICPGRHTADSSVWFGIATLLATLDFNLAKDADGKDITFEVGFMNGISRRPLPFPCDLTLRPHISRATLEQALAE